MGLRRVNFGLFSELCLFDCQFPAGWAEWNDRYRDAVRSYWKGDGGVIGELAYRITGSSDFYARSGRKPYASVNFVTAHDGFTLTDLGSYNSKHNEANGQDNRDGADNNRSWNCGAEGPTDEPEVKRLRSLQKRNFIAALFLSQGVPLLLAGDEIGHSQNGNNNTYSQDNDVSWLDWDPNYIDRELLSFVRRLIALRKDHPTFRLRSFFQGRAIKGAEVKDVVLLEPDGREMTDQEWNQVFARCLGVLLSGDSADETDERGQIIRDSNFTIPMNPHHEEIRFALPTRTPDAGWIALVDTSCQTSQHSNIFTSDGDAYPLQARSLVLLVKRASDRIRADDRRRASLL